jgi:DNA-directed RNA polymerase specialized sigma24 family protein
MKRLRPGLIASESRHGGAAAVRVVGHQPTSSRLAGVTPASTDAPVAEITAAGLPLLAAPVAGSDVTTGDTTGDTTGGDTVTTAEVSAGAGADGAVTELYGTQYRPLVRVAVLLTGDLRTAEDVVQEAFVAMHGAWGALREHAAGVPFLRHAVVTGSRSAPGEPEFPPAPQYPEGAGPARPGRRGRHVRAVPAVPEPAGVIPALRLLPRLQREALVLRLYLDLPDDQIAAAMAVPVTAARDHVAGALAAMAEVA